MPFPLSCVIYFGFIALIKALTRRNSNFSFLKMKKLFDKEGYFTVISKLRELIAAFQAVGQLNAHLLSLKNRYKLKRKAVSSYLLC